MAAPASSAACWAAWAPTVRCAARWPWCWLAAATSALALLCVAGSSSAVALFCLLVWGAAFGALPLCLQLWIMRLAGDELEAARLFVTCVQSSIAIGSALGGQLINHYGAAADARRRRGAVPGVAGVRLARHGRARHARRVPGAD